MNKTITTTKSCKDDIKQRRGLPLRIYNRLKILYLQQMNLVDMMKDDCYSERTRRSPRPLPRSSGVP